MKNVGKGKLVFSVVYGVIFILLQETLGSCVSDNVCGKMVEVDGLCYPPTDLDTTPNDGGTDTADGGVDGTDEDSTLPTGLMDDCTSNDKCTGEADYCLQPNYPDLNGYCTVQGCTLEPDDCPGDFRCLDLGTYMPGLPKVCVSPTTTKKLVLGGGGSGK